jgi:hypothetical protein
MTPDAWFWAHDARPDQIESLATPGLRLVRLSHYGSDRYAALFHSGSPTGYRLDLDAAEAMACPDAIAITADDRARFSVVTEPGAATTIHVDLDEDELRSAAGEVVDMATYTLGGSRRYAVILRPGGEPSWLLPNLSVHGLRDELDRLGGAITRLRSHGDDSRYTAVAARTKTRFYADLAADQVGDRLERHAAYPVDLDAVLTADGVRFTVVMR